jgi:hypothetical protein
MQVTWPDVDQKVEKALYRIKSTSDQGGNPKMLQNSIKSPLSEIYDSPHDISYRGIHEEHAVEKTLCHYESHHFLLQFAHLTSFEGNASSILILFPTVKAMIKSVKAIMAVLIMEGEWKPERN